MRLLSFPSHSARLLLLFPLLALSEKVISSTALEECQHNSTFTASLFNIVFTPENNTLVLNVVGDSSSEGNVTLEVHAAAYGYSVLTESINPCTESGLSSLCPLQSLQINFDTTYPNISQSVINRIPGIAYGIPDLDATVTIYMSMTASPNVSVACVLSRLSNGKTVYQVGVGWGTAVVAIAGLLASALVSGLGHSNTASHVAVYALSLFNYFQSVAIIGLCAVPLPPIVQSWTQDFSWSMGIIRVGFLQDLATWYQIGTGGKPATILQTLGTKSVQVVKRSLQSTAGSQSLVGRSEDSSVPSGEYVVKGIKRVAFRAGMEPTNLFLTGIIFFSIFVIFTTLGVTFFKFICTLAIRARLMKSHRFQTFRDDYLVTLKGIILRILLIGYPLLSILCLWEFTQIDSPAEAVLAVFIFFGVTATLGWAAFQVIQIARRSQQLHKTPAYMLYTSATTLNKWGFLYIQFRASAYYYIIPALAYILAKAIFVGLGQGNGTVQAIALVVIEAVALISASVIRPWMDKPTNAINISISAINFLNAILLLIFTGIFNGPGLLIGVSGVVFFVLNAVFALVLLLVVILAAAYSFLQKDPETRYQLAADNRGSFIKSQNTLTKELDALGVAARAGYDVDEDSGEKLDLEGRNRDLHTPDIRQQYTNKQPNTLSREGSVSPIASVTPTMPMLPDSNMSSLQGSLGVPAPSRAATPSSIADPIYVARHDEEVADSRSQHNTSPWQRGAGYDHR